MPLGFHLVVASVLRLFLEEDRLQYHLCMFEEPEHEDRRIYREVLWPLERVSRGPKHPVENISKDSTVFIELRLTSPMSLR